MDGVDSSLVEDRVACLGDARRDTDANRYVERLLVDLVLGVENFDVDTRAINVAIRASAEAVYNLALDVGCRVSVVECRLIVVDTHVASVVNLAEIREVNVACWVSEVVERRVVSNLMNTILLMTMSRNRILHQLKKILKNQLITPHKGYLDFGDRKNGWNELSILRTLSIMGAKLLGIFISSLGDKNRICL